MSHYKMYVSTISYYSGKLEAYVRYKELPHERIEIDGRAYREILANTGMQKMPAMQCPDGRWLKDTTPMMRWLDTQHPDASIYPNDPAQHFLSLLLEDYADEWLWRPAMHYRWSFPEANRLVSRLGARLIMKAPQVLVGLLRYIIATRQYRIFVRGDGVRAYNRRHVEAVYTRSLDQLSKLLRSQPFLHGARPGIVDFAYFGSMYRHFSLDPEPAEIMRTHAPAVYEWVARLWNARASRVGMNAMASFDTAAWDAVLADIDREYLPYLDQNAKAWKAGRKRFDAIVGDVRYPGMPVVRYRVACREQLHKAYAVLEPVAKARVNIRLARTGITQWLESSEQVAAGLDAEFEMPLAPRYRHPSGLYGLKLFNGTPWDMHPDAVKDSGVAGGS